MTIKFPQIKDFVIKNNEEWDKPNESGACCPFQVGCIKEDGILVGTVFAQLISEDECQYLAFFSDEREPIKDYTGPWESCVSDQQSQSPLIPISLHCY